MVTLTGNEVFTTHSQIWVFSDWSHPLLKEIDLACNFLLTRFRTKEKPELSEDLIEILKASDLTAWSAATPATSGTALFSCHQFLPATWLLILPQESQSPLLWISKMKSQARNLQLTSLKIFLPQDAALTEIQNLLTTEESFNEVYVVEWPKSTTPSKNL